MSLDDIVSVSITKATQTVKRTGYGTPMLVGYHTHWLDRVREYTSLSAMVADGFTTAEPLYLMAAACFSQSPRPRKVKVGRRAGAPVRSLRIGPLDLTVSKRYTFNVVNPAGLVTAIDVVGDATPTAPELAALLVTAIDAIADVAAVVAAVNFVDITCTSAGQFAFLTGLPARSVMSVEDKTPNPATTIQTDLAAIQLADPDWYGLLIDSNGSLEIQAAAAWAESNSKLFAWSNADSAIADSGSTTDVAYVLEAAAYARTLGLYEQSSTMAYAGCAYLGRMLPTTPGKATWAFKALAGVPHSQLTDTEAAAVKAKSCNILTTEAGATFTMNGVSASGEYVDITHGSDALKTDMQERILSAKLKNDKIGYDEEGLEITASEVRGALASKIADNFIESFTVALPALADISDVDKGNRELNSVEWDAVLTGAIHVTSINGRIAV